MNKISGDLSISCANLSKKMKLLKYINPSFSHNTVNVSKQNIKEID